MGDETMFCKLKQKEITLIKSDEINVGDIRKDIFICSKGKYCDCKLNNECLQVKYGLRDK